MTQYEDRQTRSIWLGVEKGASPMFELDEAIVVSDKVSFERSAGIVSLLIDCFILARSAFVPASGTDCLLPLCLSVDCFC